MVDFAERGRDFALNDVMKMLIRLNDVYDASLSEVSELEETLEQMTQFLSQSKSTLHINDDQQLRKLLSAFTPGGNGRRHTPPPAASNPIPAQMSEPPVKSRRAIHQHHRPSPSQLLLRGTKWISGRRCTGSSVRGGPFRGVKNRVLSTAVHRPRSRINGLQRRNQVTLEHELNNRTRKASVSSSSSSSGPEEYNRAHQRPRSTLSPVRGRKRDAVRAGNTVGDAAVERLYCLCKKLSYGDMIACDNVRCEIEWFHFACVDIKVQPKGRWYCPRCRGDSSKVKRVDA
ncbi:unnamed protein product [Mesocestoides corti]|uniref:PHD-type domain-containing protein n=1 Tax=Mesocestoides corti TaxID=53468 RepID=A0A3P6HPY7_MESCO|nr:unnamed protein product [Mesocestoides corti]